MSARAGGAVAARLAGGLLVATLLVGGLWTRVAGRERPARGGAAPSPVQPDGRPGLAPRPALARTAAGGRDGVGGDPLLPFEVPAGDRPPERLEAETLERGEREAPRRIARAAGGPDPLAARTEPAPGDRSSERTEVPRLGGVAEQVRHATRARQALAGSRGRERSRLRARAAEACRAVRIHFPEARAEGAEAAFRAGEIWRADEDDARARAEFEVAIELAPEGPFAARALLELAHLERRAGERERALAGYTRVLADGSAAPRLRASAALSAGVLHRERGARELARSLWEQVAGTAEDPRDRVEAFDRLALDLVAAGDLEGAAGTLARARRELFECSRELTERGERARTALSGMRAIGELEDAVRRRREGVRIDGRAARAVE